MVGNTRLLEKENAAFADEKPPVRISHSALSQTAVIMDELLENTLLNAKLDISLTKREAEILKLIVVGNTNKKIAQKISRTERTVEYHRHRLMRKLGAHNAADLVKRALAIGIV
jgi:DNA-binding NarL/FixJ family response regulator